MLGVWVVGLVWFCVVVVYFRVWWRCVGVVGLVLYCWVLWYGVCIDNGCDVW